MIFSFGYALRGCLPALETWRETWRLRGLTVQAMVLLCVARVLVQVVPLRFWRASLGQLAAPSPATPDAPVTRAATAAGKIAAHVDRAAARLPFATKCLPRAMALCWLLRLRKLPYALQIAVRPAASRGGTKGNGTGAGDDLHAWVVSESVTVIGDLPGPWLVLLVLHG